MYVASPSKEYMGNDFDNLPENIRQSNIDNAYHIPSKLLSIGLEIRKTKADEETPLLFLSDSDIETMFRS